MPATAAIGGVVVPGLIYAMLNWGDPERLNGWAIPTATDIAFALGIMALLGKRVPLALKVLLTAIAIFDDLGAIIIIAVFYTADLSALSLVLAAVAIGGLVLLNMFGVRHVGAYILVGVVLWVLVLKSGVHATLAGVVCGLAIPLRVEDSEGHSLLRHLEHILHPWVAFAILPIFAFANAGISFAGMGLDSFTQPVSLGIALGLFAGKQIGVFGLMVIAIKSGLAEMPEGVGWRQLYSVSLFCGIGFTMSLFIGSLAFEHTGFEAPIRLGVLTGSIISGAVGYALLRFSPVPVNSRE